MCVHPYYPIFEYRADSDDRHKWKFRRKESKIRNDSGILGAFLYSGRALFNHDAKLRQGVEDDSSTMVEEGADPQWHQAGAGGRMQHLRKKKVMQRKRTRDLYYTLDPLVPVRGELVLGEKGSLPSRRTFLQLQNDARAHLRDLKVQRDAAASRRPAGPGAKSDSAAAGGAGGGSAALHRSMMREGMLASSQLLLLEVSTASWAVLRMSRGLRLLFSKHPRGACAIEGECLLHYVEAQDTSVLRAACRAPVGAGAPEFTIGLRTFEASFTTIRKCRVQRIASHLPEQQLFMLSLLVAVPRPVRPVHACACVCECMCV